ncbi:LPS assembly lipoprotein LptE [Nibricoccus sp. IMCC34717]|uniref:LPS assembly lipoprotein LptE n=1 Tax=Nibricoccus sp. IMCC34717 TaxID=3034021 RepID=UPI00384CECB7
MLRLFRHGLLLAAAALALTGCGSYQLGTGTEPAFRSLYVAPVTNDAGIPQAAALFSRELREAFLRDGRVSLASTAEAADAVLEISLQSYERQATSALPQDTRLARKFDLELTARATLRAHGGKEIFRDRELNATRQVYTTATSTGEISRQQQAEFNTQPLLARRLAEEAVHIVLDTW